MDRLRWPNLIKVSLPGLGSSSPAAAVVVSGAGAVSTMAIIFRYEYDARDSVPCHRTVLPSGCGSVGATGSSALTTGIAKSK
jgi:hypothetical protein